MEWTSDNQNTRKGDVRSAINDAYTELLESGKSFDYSDIRVQTSTPTSAPIPKCVRLEETEIIRVIRVLQPAESAWLRYCYGATESRGGSRSMMDEYQDIETISKWLWQKHLATLEKPLSPEKHGRLMGFVLPALQQIQREMNTGKRLYTITRLLELTADTVGATENCWKRDWHPHWKSLCALLRKLDHESLLFCISALNTDQKRKNANAFIRETA
jgi:hypothetical protein